MNFTLTRNSPHLNSHQPEQASESALNSRNNISETVKHLGGTGGPPIILDYSKENKLSVEILSLYESLLPTMESHEKRKLLANKVEKILNDEWPDKDIKVHMFGSSMNELGTTHSDVDLCVTTHWNGLKNIFILTRCLEKYKEDILIQQTVPKAKVPIVRLYDEKLHLSCDINVNNTLALHNTRLIRKYVSIDPRVRPLAMIVKYWARNRVLNDAAKGGTISTYTWTCIILNFLQMRDPPILPVLHKIPHEGVEPIMVNGEDASFFEDVNTLTEFGSKNKETVGGLLFAFFRRMAFEFDYDHHVISLRQGTYLTKEEKGWDICKGWKMLCVEEPFNTARNLGNSADDTSVIGLIGEFRRACNILYETACLNKLCEEYHFPPPPSRNNNHYCGATNRRSNNNYKQRPCKFNRKGMVKSHQQNGQNNNTTDNSHDINGKSNEEEEDESSMRRFGSEESTPVSENISYFCGNSEYSTRKQFDNIQNQNRRYINQHHNVPKEDEQSRPRSRQRTSFHPMKKKNDDQFNNYGQSQDSEHEGFVRYDDSISNQSQPVYKNNKAENILHKKSSSRFQHSSCSDQKPFHLSNTITYYDLDNKYHSRHLNIPSDSDQKSFVTYNPHDPERKPYYKSHSNKHGYNSKQVEEPIIDLSSNSNFERSNNLNQISSPKSSNKSNNRSRKNMQSPRQHQKVNENADFTNFYYKVDDSISSTQSNNGNGNLTATLSHNDIPLSCYRQSNDGSTSYQRRMSHQSSSDGSNSQTSGNTSNTSNTSYSSTHSTHTKNNYPKNNGQNYQQQNHQYKPNYYRKKKYYSNNNNNNTNGYNNSGNGNFRMNTTTNNSTSIALNCSDSNFQDVTFSTNQGQGGQGHYNSDYNVNSDINGYKAHNSSIGSFKVFNNSSNSSNSWKGSNGHYNTNSKIINGNSNVNNGTKLVNGGNTNRSANSNNSNNNYPRPNFNNHNHSNNHMKYPNNNNHNANSHKSINGSNNKPFDGSNNSNTQTRNFNNNYSNSKNGGNNQINNKRNNRPKNSRSSVKPENKDDGINYHQQCSQEATFQPSQHKKMGQNGQNNNYGKGKQHKKNNSKQNVECQQQQ